MNIGEKVKDLREALNLTQKEFAEKIGGKGDWTYIGKIERGDQWPSLKYLSRIAEVHHKPLSYFFQNGEPVAVEKKDRRNAKMKALACLLTRWNWQLADFRACRRACDQMPLCRTVKVLVNR